MGVLVKYTLESILIAGSTAALIRGQMSLKRFLVLASLSMLLFIVLDLFAPIKEVHVQLGGADPAATPEPDMCGGSGLVQALQELNLTGGSAKSSEPQVEDVDVKLKFKNHPYKLRSGIYGAGILTAGFNENVGNLVGNLGSP